jgi:hypothetical protein
MFYTFFSKEIANDYSYLLLGVYHNGVYNCGSYFNDEDDEYIISILTGEKFYSVNEFVFSIMGYDMNDEWLDCSFYNEETGNWISLQNV